MHKIEQTWAITHRSEDLWAPSILKHGFESRAHHHALFFQKIFDDVICQLLRFEKEKKWIKQKRKN